MRDRPSFLLQWLPGALLMLWASAFQGLLAQSRIVDDSTKMVYGPYTTYYQTFDDVRLNRYNLHKIDTLVTRRELISYVNAFDNTYQDLGNIGTSIRSLYYDPPDHIGLRSGFDSYRLYRMSLGNREFYDTRSPYTLVDAFIGGQGRAMTTVKHSRNINPYWNMTAYYHRIVADKQVARKNRGDRQSISNAYYLNSSYQSKNGKFHSLASLARSNHRVRENGGIRVPENPVNADFFDENAQVNLTGPESSELVLDMMVYNQYKLRDALQFYHLMALSQTKNSYIDKNLRQNASFYDQILINPDSTTDRGKLSEWTNELGLKGDLAGLFYNAYLRLRDAGYTHPYLSMVDKSFEMTVGGNLRYDIDSLQYVHAAADYLFPNYYRIGGRYTMKFLEAEYWRMRYKPGAIEQTYFGNHHEWYNNFEATTSDQLRGSILLRWKSLLFAPGLDLTNVRNRIYYGYDKNPAQASGNVQLLSPRMRLNFRLFKSVYLENEGIYTMITGDSEAANTFRTPTILANSRVYFGNHLFDRKIYVEIGTGLHYKSEYIPEAYDPAIQQFYLQDDFVNPAYLIADLFFNFQIDHVTVTLKYTHANQSPLDGYFTYAGYIGQNKTLDVAIRWMFFN
jgi:hypothetical protein